MKVTLWTKAVAEKELKKRFKRAVEYRKLFEGQWKENEKYLFPVQNVSGESISYNSHAELAQKLSIVAGDGKSITLPRIKKNVRYLHAQMSANPPSAVALPESPDDSCRRAATAARHIMKWGARQYHFQEVTDMTCLNAIVYGTGIGRLYHDKNKGKVSKYDRVTGEVTVDGDIAHKSISIWDYWCGSNTKSTTEWEEGWERIRMPFEEAVALWPEARGILEEAIINPNRDWQEWGDEGIAEESRLDLDKQVEKEQIVEILEYHQKASIFNANLGYHCFHTMEGKLISEIEDNPTPNAEIPYGVITDLDVPGHFYAKSTVDFALPIMRVVDQIDTMVLDNLESHGNLKLVVYESAEVNDDDLNTNPTQVIRISGTAQQAPNHLVMPSLAIDFYKLRENLLAAIDEMMGINEVIQGQFQKDMSGFSAQTAINAANLVRRRLFNKYTLYVEKMYTLLLDNVRKYWDKKRKVPVVGEEDSANLPEYDKSDVASGFILQAQYGQNFSLDPAQRREEIMQAQPLLKEAGVNPKALVRMLKYNEVEGLFDSIEIARARQLEIFQAAVKLFEDADEIKIMPAWAMTYAMHDMMAEAAQEYFMTREFLQLDPRLKEAMYEHQEARMQCAALMAAGKKPTEQAVSEAIRSAQSSSAAAPEAAAANAGSAPQIPGLPPMPGASPASAAPAAEPASGVTADAGVVI